jgi:hypothetical protein
VVDPNAILRQQIVSVDAIGVMADPRQSSRPRGRAAPTVRQRFALPPISDWLTDGWKRSTQLSPTAKA